MRKFYFFGFLILLAFDTLAQVGFKLAATSTAPVFLDLAWLHRAIVEKWIYCAIVGYLGAFVTYMTILKHAPIGPAFAATHLEVVTVLLVSVLFLGERLSPIQIIGALLVMGGIALLASQEQSAPELTAGSSSSLDAA